MTTRKLTDQQAVLREALEHIQSAVEELDAIFSDESGHFQEGFMERTGPMLADDLRRFLAQHRGEL